MRAASTQTVAQAIRQDRQETETRLRAIPITTADIDLERRIVDDERKQGIHAKEIEERVLRERICNRRIAMLPPVEEMIQLAMATRLNVLGGGCNGVIYGKPAPLICKCDMCQDLANDRHILKATPVAPGMQTFKIKQRIESCDALSDRERAHFVLPKGHIIHLSHHLDVFPEDHIRKSSVDGMHTVPIMNWIFTGPSAKTSVGFYMEFAGKSLEALLMSGDKMERLAFLRQAGIWVPQLLDAVFVLHTKCRIAHNDLQLRNILWDDVKKQLSLIDWELAAIHRDNHDDDDNKGGGQETRFDQRTGQLTILRFFEISKCFWYTKRQQYLYDWDYVLQGLRRVLQLKIANHDGDSVVQKQLQTAVSFLEQYLTAQTAEMTWFPALRLMFPETLAGPKSAAK